VWNHVCHHGRPAVPLSPKQVSDAIASGVNAKISDGHNLYLVAVASQR
jgi:hypothetical protein